MKIKLLNIWLLCVSMILCVSLFEFTIRFFIKPSPECYGILFNKIELPPFKIKIWNDFPPNYIDHPVSSTTVDGKKITNGDILGERRYDPVAGYVNKENFLSYSGWVKTNNLGARSETDIEKNIPPGKQRVIIFGDSFTFCNGLPGEETWPALLNNKSNNTEFFNFGVGGYGMGQCLLRYETIRNKMNYDTVMLVFLPEWDPYRDINDLRQLIGWQTQFLIPRFTIENNQLKLIKSPYKTNADFHRENKNQLSGQLKKYLRTYDRFYFSAKYESPPFLGDLILYKLLARAVYTYQGESLQRNMMAPRSEAMTISLKIFKKFHEDAKNDGKKFILVSLPVGDISRYSQDSKFRQHYDEMISSIKKEGVTCIDLMEDLSEIKPEQFDIAHDGIHYGPNTNKMISGILWRRLKDLKLIVPA